MTMFETLSGDLTGVAGSRPPLVLLHGLTYDRRQWGPLLRELPGRQALALDLPGHGESPGRDSYRLGEVASAVAGAVAAARLEAPIVVGHSIGAVIATSYAARFPAVRVVNIDQPLLPGPFGDLVRRAEPTLRGPEWRSEWESLLAGLHPELLPPEVRGLAVEGSRARPELLLGYWDELIHGTDAGNREARSRELTAVTARGVGYRFVAASEPPAPYLEWLRSVAPRVAVDVLPGSHFPHLGYPGAVAALLDGPALVKV